MTQVSSRTSPDPRQRRSRAAWAYVLAAATAGAAVVLRILLIPFLGSETFTLFYPVLLLIAWYAGAGPASVFTGIVAAGMFWTYHPDGDPLGVHLVPRLVNTGLFITAAMVISSLIHGRRATERRLRAGSEAQARLAAIVESSDDAVVSKDLDGVVRSWNPGAERLFGYSAAEMVGRSIRVLIPKDRWREEDDILARIRRGEQVRLYDTERLTKEGRRIDISVSISPVRDERGVVIGAAKIARDISERKVIERTLRESEGRFRAVFETDAVPANFWEADGRITDANQAFLRLIGATRADLEAGRLRWDSITPPEYTDRNQAALREVLTRGKCEPFEKEYMRPDGTRIPVMVGAAVLPGFSDRGISFALDLSELKRTQRELHQSNIRLEAAVEERTRELEESHHRLRINERLVGLGTLAAGIGHDLGNLLLPIRTRLDTLESEGLTPSQREDLEAIRKAAEYLSDLSRRLRLLSRAPDAEGKAEQPTRLDEWWIAVGPLMRNPLPRHVALDADLAADLPPVAIGMAALTQAVFNIVQNAGDALRLQSNGRVSIRGTLADGHVLLSIADNGPGMSPDIRRRCLEPYFSTKPRAISTGMGLALVRGIIERARGSLEIESEPGRGATFVLGLPVASQPAPTGARASRTALVSVSDGRTAAYLRSFLPGLGFRLRTIDGAPNGDAHLWILDEQSAGAPLREFLASHPERRAVILGRAPAGIDPAQVLELPLPFTPSVTLDRVTALVRSLDD